MCQLIERTMKYNDTNYYSYFTKPYEFGWMVYHIENGQHIMDDCFANEGAANQVALSRNIREAKRVAEAKERLEASRKNLVLHSGPYYSITGFYGD